MYIALVVLAAEISALVTMGPVSPRGRRRSRRRSQQEGIYSQSMLGYDQELPLLTAAPVLQVKGRGRAAKRRLERVAEERYSFLLRKLLKSEREEEEKLARERIETWSKQRLAASGMALLGLGAEKRRHAFYGRPVVRVYLSSENNSTAKKLKRLPFHRFGPGDLVMLSSSRGVDQLEAAVLERTPFYLDLALNNGGGMLDFPSFGKKKSSSSSRTTSWRLDQYYSTVSYDRMEAAVDAVTATSSGYFEARIGKLKRERDELAPELKKIVVRSALCLDDTTWSQLAAEPSAGLCRRAPSLNAARAAVADLAPWLDASQKTAASRSLRERLSLIQGPPGTGKTNCAAAIIAAAIRLRDLELNRGVRGELPIEAIQASKKRALVCAASNVAADNLLERLLDFGLSAIRIGNPASVRPSLRQATLDAKVRDPYNNPDAAFSVLLQADVIVSSCVGAGGDLLAPFLAAGTSSRTKNAAAQTASSLKFGLVLLDEAAQATEPQCLVPLATALGATQLILVGDPNQLPPVVLSRESRDNGLGTSLFQRLQQDAGIQASLLSRQYRMHPAINAWPSRRFYKNKVSTCPVVAENRLSQPPPLLQGLLSPEQPLLFFAVTDGHEERGDHDSASASYYNQAEVHAVAAAVDALLAAGATPQDIGIVTPYAAQARAIIQHLAADNTSPSLVEVSTVDGYQGREKNIMLISAVRANQNSDLGFLADARRLNVAITRPRQALLVFGHPETLRSDSHWCAFHDHCRRIGCARTFRASDLQPSFLSSSDND